jgi:hypothetical protein
MKLDAWIRQGHPLPERLRIVERLSQALNAIHDRGQALVALAPARVEVTDDLECDLSAAERGSTEPGYTAPERTEGGPPSAEADIYSAGAIVWEVLVGRPCGEMPASLPDIAPDLPGELASAVMGCLERSPQWRPKDLTYLAQLAAAHQKAMRRGSEPDAEDAPRLTRGAPAQRSARRSPPRTAPRRPSRSHLPLLIATVLVLGAAALSYWWIQRQGPDGVTAPARIAASAVPAAPAPTATPMPEPRLTPVAEPTPAGSVEQPEAPISTPTPTPIPSSTPEPEPTPTPTPTPTPRPTPTATPTPEPAAVAPVVPAPAPAEPAPAPTEPAVLTALSPLSVRRPGRALLDLRGTGLRPDLNARIVAVREVPRGISVARQKWVNANLMTVLLELEGTVTPGAYAVALEDPSGGQLTKPLQFTVTK